MFTNENIHFHQMPQTRHKQIEKCLTTPEPPASQAFFSCIPAF
jgi:hypothetical protein